MKMKIWLTEASDIKHCEVVDSDKIIERIFDWQDDAQVLDVPSNKEGIVKIHKISLFDHLMIIDNVLCKPLVALSKSSF